MLTENQAQSLLEFYYNDGICSEGCRIMYHSGVLKSSWHSRKRSASKKYLEWYACIPCIQRWIKEQRLTVSIKSRRKKMKTFWTLTHEGIALITAHAKLMEAV